MKYMILTYASQQDYDGMIGAEDAPYIWTPEELAAMGSFMESFAGELAASGELVDTQGLSAPVHTRRVRLAENGLPVVSDGPYAEAQEVLAGYWVVDCASFDRATEIAGRLANCPAPEHVRLNAVADVRPIDEYQDEPAL